MLRKPGSNRSGGAFDSATINAVWNKAKPVPGVDPAHRRMDACNAWIDRSMYGVTNPHGSGWEIDHMMPVSKGGPDALTNLQPLQWQNNRAKGDGTALVCVVVAAKSTALA